MRLSDWSSDVCSSDLLNQAREFKVGISVVNPDEPVTSQETYVEELQLQGHAFDGDLQWQAGAYYEHSLPDGFSGNNSAGLISCDLASLEKDPSQFNCFDVTAGLDRKSTRLNSSH